jgi:hypothetical protein
MEKGMTVQDLIDRLLQCNPEAHVMLDDNGIATEIVEIADEGYSAYTHDGALVNVVDAVYRGQREAAARMRHAMADVAARNQDDDQEGTSGTSA